jgi:hypothetical protein
LREAFGNTASLASLIFWFSINHKTDFYLLLIHSIIHYIAIFLNIASSLANFYLFVLSFNDYFEYKEKNDYDELMENRRRKPDEENDKKNN